jgi:acyl carrier protein
MSTTILSIDQLEAELLTFIANTFILGQPSYELTNQDSLLDRGVIDSTGVLELIAFLEETYGIAIPDEEIVPENLDSISNIAQYILRKKGFE